MRPQVIDETVWMPGGRRWRVPTAGGAALAAIAAPYGHPPSTAAAPPHPDVDRFLRRARRLPSFVRPLHTDHRVGAGGGGPLLLRLLQVLQGKLVVVNPLAPAVFPEAVAARVRALAGEADRIALALAEASAPCVTLGGVAEGGAGPAADLRFHGELRYRLTARVERRAGGRPVTLPAGERRVGRVPRVAALPPQHWFHLHLLVPDEIALRQMSADAAHAYREATGRFGGAGAERYWYLRAWERYEEPGRVAGHVNPLTVLLGHRARSGAPRTDDGADSLLDQLLAGSGGAPPSRWSALTPDHDRGGLVPPGYCLIHYVATVELAVVTGAAESAA